MKVRLFLNNQEQVIEVDSNRTLLDVLRTDLGLTGTKYGCGIGECGACTVIIDGKAKNACLVLIGQVDGKKVETVEGLAQEINCTRCRKHFKKNTRFNAVIVLRDVNE